MDLQIPLPSNNEFTNLEKYICLNKKKELYLLSRLIKHILYTHSMYIAKI